MTEDKKTQVKEAENNLRKKILGLIKKIKYYNRHYKRQARNIENALYYESIPRIIALEDIVNDLEKQLEKEVKHESYEN